MYCGTGNGALVVYMLTAGIYRRHIEVAKTKEITRVLRNLILGLTTAVDMKI